MDSEVKKEIKVNEDIEQEESSFQNTPWVKTREETEKAGDLNCLYKNGHNPRRLMVTYREPEECLDENGHRYVGLVNQASTCYLNSLIQTLYMTPEFRNAIYKWQFNGSNAQEHKNIQFQLQKLFLTLQTNQKSSLETKDLTTSFGWDSNEAYDQHDVQELCRVMFDALERFWRKSSNSTTIQDLYEGTVEDYVKCLNCGTESMRKDIFLDLPLSVKEFGASFPYKSVEEALDAFIKPEILNENNQYDCSKCCGKQDAEKGLRITEFPYLLTIQLKRFDFDYETLHRIKLNDRITFPDFLDINGHLYRPKVPEPPKISYAAAAAKAKPEPKPTGSGDITPEDPFSSTNEKAESKTASTSDYDFSNEEKCWLNVSANSDQVLHLLEQKGKYIYELFSIMVHQGSAAAGHYFAYIKNMDQNKWFCFNDSSVQSASKHDIFRTFGGWSYGYMNNTNAYMLMYRRVDPQRNESFVRSIDLPLHLKELQAKLLNEEQERIKFLEETVKVIFHCNEERCRNSNPLCINLNKDIPLDVVFINLLNSLNEVSNTYNIRGGGGYPEFEHKFVDCSRLVLSNRDWNMLEVIYEYVDPSSDNSLPSKDDVDGQIEGGYCVGSDESYKRPISSLISELPSDRNSLPEVFLIIDTKSPDDEQFLELGMKYKEAQKMEMMKYSRKDNLNKDLFNSLLKTYETSLNENNSSELEKDKQDEKHEELRPVAVVPPTFKRHEKSLTIKDDTYEDIPSTSDTFSEGYGYRVDDPVQPPPYSLDSSMPSTPMISPVVSDGSEDENKMEFRAIGDNEKNEEKLMRVKMFLDREAP